MLPNGNGAAAVNMRNELNPIRFLSILRITVVDDASSPLPLGLLAAIVGALGPCSTQASRRAETSTVQLTAATLRLHLAPTAPTDALLAIKTAPFFKAKLPPARGPPGPNGLRPCALRAPRLRRVSQVVPRSG